QVSPLSCFH
ncbi:amino acid permease family protein, partial [Vibrio parahaemolyticus V-223/04]